MGEGRHSPVDVREDEATRIDNQIDVFAKTFLALTVSCARCHDHKFDAITQKDYYALAGFLQSSRYQQSFLDDPAQLAPLLDELRALREREQVVFADFLRSVREPVLARLTAAIDPSTDQSEAPRKRLADLAAQPHDVLHPLVALNIPPASTADANFVARRAELSTALDKRMAEATARDEKPLADFAGSTFDGWVTTGPAFGMRPARPGDLYPTAADGSTNDASGWRLIGTAAAHSGLVADKLSGVLRSPTFTIDQPRIYYRLWGTGGKVRLILDGLQLIQNPIYGGLEFGPGGAAPHWHEQNVEKWIGHRAYIELIDDGPGWIALAQVVQGDHPPTADRPNALIARLVGDPKNQSPIDLAVAYRRLFDETIHGWLTRAAEQTAESADNADRCEIINAALSLAAVDPADARLAQANEQARQALTEIGKERGDYREAAGAAPRWPWPTARPRMNAFSFAAITKRRASACRGAGCKSSAANNTRHRPIAAAAWNWRDRSSTARRLSCRA